MIVDISGQRFGRLTVLKMFPIREDNWRCLCDCGKEITVNGYLLKIGNTKSCGCLRNEKFIDMLTTHGMSKTRFYKNYHGMLQRCYNPKPWWYKDYGGRGIRVCERWHDFNNYKEDMYDSYQIHVQEHGMENTFIDRIDYNGNFCKENCYWATKDDKKNNIRLNRSKIKSKKKLPPKK